MIKSIVVLLCLTAFASSEVLLGKRSAIALQETALEIDSLDEFHKISKINDFIDVVLEEIENVMGEVGVDPFNLPDIHRNFSFKPIIITYHGELDLENGLAKGISHIVRDGDVILEYKDRVMKVDVPIKFTEFLFNYDYNVKLMDLGPDGSVTGRVVDVKIFFSISLDFEALRVKLNKFDIKHIGKISVKFEGNGLLDWLVNLLSGLVTGIFKGIIEFISEGIVRKVIVLIIDAINGIFSIIRPDEFMYLADNLLS